MSVASWWYDFNRKHNILADVLLPSKADYQAATDATAALHQANMKHDTLAAQVAKRRAEQASGNLARTTQQAVAVANAPSKVGHAIQAGTSAIKTAAIILVGGFVVVEVIASRKGGK